MITDQDINDFDEATVWIGATRYYCGRMTYAVGDFCAALCRKWETLPEQAKKIIKRDLEKEFERDDKSRAGMLLYAIPGHPLGHDCDRAAWEKVRLLWK